MAAQVDAVNTVAWRAAKSIVCRLAIYIGVGGRGAPVHGLRIVLREAGAPPGPGCPLLPLSCRVAVAVDDLMGAVDDLMGAAAKMLFSKL